MDHKQYRLGEVLDGELCVVHEKGLADDDIQRSYYLCDDISVVRSVSDKMGGPSGVIYPDVVSEEEMDTLTQSLTEVDVADVSEKISGETPLTPKESGVYVLRVLFGIDRRATARELSLERSSVDSRLQRVWKKYEQSKRFAQMPGKSGGVTGDE